MWIQIIKDQLKDCNIQYIKTGYNIVQDRDKIKHLTHNRLKVDQRVSDKKYTQNV